MSCTQIELAMRCTRSTRPRSKIILGPTKRFAELRRNLEQRRGLPNSWHTTFNSGTAGYNAYIKKLIEKFEKHQHKESYLKDLSQMQKINKMSKESQDLIADMNNTEIFELCENSSNQQCLECITFWENGIIYCSCGRNMKSSQSPTNLCNLKLTRLKQGEDRNQERFGEVMLYSEKHPHDRKAQGQVERHHEDVQDCELRGQGIFEWRLLFDV